MKQQILVIDGNDCDDLSTRLLEALPDQELSIISTGSPAEGLRLAADIRPAVILFDSCFPDFSGIRFLEEANKLHHKASIIMTTSCGNVSDTIETIRHGAFDYFIKPPDRNQLREVMLKAIECSILSSSVRHIQSICHLDGSHRVGDIMIGSSPAMMKIWKLVGKIADSDATILIQGESGTGKELLARGIYSHSNRSDRPFLAINCAALPETLLESELFGHEKGAFTDAHQRRIGKFEYCNGGTILLDEISEMSLPSQSKLLRLLENQEFERLGGNQSISIDVRVIAATNVDLLEAVEQKKFRLDLYHRLKGISVQLPPLRERREDIPILIELFCRHFSERYGKEIRGVSAKAASWLLNAQWSGNIRELKNMIGSAVATARGEILRIEDFCQGQAGTVKEDQATEDGDYCAYFVKLLEPVAAGVRPDELGSFYQKVSQGLEKAAITLALKRTDNNQVLTARMLGISRNTLRSKIGRYRL